MMPGVGRSEVVGIVNMYNQKKKKRKKYSAMSWFNIEVWTERGINLEILQ